MWWGWSGAVGGGIIVLEMLIEVVVDILKSNYDGNERINLVYSGDEVYCT